MKFNSRFEITPTKVIYLLALVVLAVGSWLTVSLLWGSLPLGWLVVFALLGWLFTSALMKGARSVAHQVWIGVGLLMLAGLSLPAAWLADNFPYRSWEAQPFAGSLALSLFLLLSLALVTVAVLPYRGYLLYQAGSKEEAATDGTLTGQRVGWGTAALFVLSALVLAKALHHLHWLVIWDNTYDSLDFLWLPIPMVGILFAGAFLFIALPGRAKMIGVVYLLLIPALLIGVFVRAERVDYHHLTEERATTVAQALETYYDRHGRYPDELRQMIPWTKFSLPGPVTIYGQPWCYDGGRDYYRLGYVDREHWSDPRLIGRIHQINGQVPFDRPLCAEEVTAIQQRFPDYPYTYWKDEPG